MAYCCVPGCRSFSRQNKDNTSFHKFPQDRELQKKWIVKIRRDIGPNFQITKNTRVCSKHFSPECFSRTLTGIRKLKGGSVPSVFTWTQQPNERKTLRSQEKWHLEEEHEEDESSTKDGPSNEEWLVEIYHTKCVPYFLHYKAHLKAFNFLKKMTVSLIIRSALYMDQGAQGVFI
ncbi:THAP domain-containing protein 1-like isoform X1 [Carassius auratus]|uniref:THAP domain-containing protein 1 n=2 Tax=Carassius TaxID=7956 RepID=A0A6P6JQQ0_CARAU|nr:THAP domain-containing protein 1-like isoform X1 [Carassius auratus]